MAKDARFAHWQFRGILGRRRQRRNAFAGPFLRGYRPLARLWSPCLAAVTLFALRSVQTSHSGLYGVALSVRQVSKFGHALTRYGRPISAAHPLSIVDARVAGWVHGHATPILAECMLFLGNVHGAAAICEWLCLPCTCSEGVIGIRSAACW